MRPWPIAFVLLSGLGGLHPIAAPAGTVQPQLVLAVIGDYGCQPASTCPSLRTEQQLAVATMVHAWNPDAIVAVGDNSYEHGCGPQNPPDSNCPAGSNDILPDQQPYQADITNGTFYELVGNHDAEHIQNVLLGGSGPNCASAANCGYLFNRPSHYVAHFGNGLLDLFATDMNSADPDGDCSTCKQAQQYLADVSASSAIWKVTADHQPFYSSGQHGTQIYTHWAVVPQIDLFLSGHDHDMEHLTYNGQPYVVSGVGGKELYGFKHAVCPFAGISGVSDCAATTVWRDDLSPYHFGAVRLTITPTTLKVEFAAVSSSSSTGTVLHAFTLTKSGTVSGAVTDSMTGAGIAGATISAGGSSTITNNSGSYTLAGLPIGPTTVSASAAGYSSPTQLVDVSAGSTATSNFSLSPLPGAISGTVIDAASGRGIAAARVSYSGSSTTASALGGYAIPGVAEGTYSLTASAIGFVPQSQTVIVGPGGSLQVNFALAAVIPTEASTQQYQLTGSDGSRWTDLDATNLSLRITPAVDSQAILSGSADLWTASPGINQDLAISVNGSVATWKESGGFAGTFSPNAAHLEAVYPMTAGTTYLVKLVWKTNKAAPGATIYAGAGPIGAQFSPTRLTAQLVPTSTRAISTAATTLQYHLTSSDGSTWTDMDSAGLTLSVTPAVAAVALIGGNADLWTANAGVNQDIGISVNGTLVAWKESAGFSGTFSPNAAFVQAAFPMSAGTTYTVRLQWKANRPAAGATIYAGAGPIGGTYSPTRLTVRLVTPASGVSSAVSTQQYFLPGSDGSSWADLDSTHLSLTVTPSSNCVAVLSGNTDLWTATAGFNQDVGIEVNGSIAAWKESGGFAGTASPNAVLVDTVFPMSAGTTYTIKLRWKTNKPGAAATIYAGAGPIGTQFSPSSLTVLMIPN